MKCTPESRQGNFVQLRLEQYTLKWVRHTEFTRYSPVQSLPFKAGLDSEDPELMAHLKLPQAWLVYIPGRTFSAIKLVMLKTDFKLRDSGFESREVLASIIESQEQTDC